MFLSKTLLRRHSVLPGFDLALGLTLLYLSLIVLIPLSATFIRTTGLTWEGFLDAVATPRVVASYKLTFGASLLAALLNAVFGLLVAWVLVRYQFVGRRMVDALVDLPFALPTAVAHVPWRRPTWTISTARKARCWRPRTTTGLSVHRWRSTTPSSFRK